jgi:glycosyltransferase involved in cell wall biosynthesis
MIKYSIIVPVKNSLKYLPECIKSVTQQDYTDYELIISDDHSEDGTKEYLAKINHPNIKIIHTTEPLSVVKHFEFALNHASGKWLMFLGGDDGVQPYFFCLADRMTDIAMKKDIRSIVSRRAYYFWKGCEGVYGNVLFQYYAEFKNSFGVRNSSTETIKTLLGFKEDCYHSLPTMYMTSLIHHSLLEEMRSTQNGNFINYAFPDAYLAALNVLFEKKYLECKIPVGWVGTSPKSVYRDKELYDQIKKIPDVCGDYSIESVILFFFGALYSARNIIDKRGKKIFMSKTFIHFMFGAVLLSLRNIGGKDLPSKIVMLKQAIKINRCSFGCVFVISYIFIILNTINKCIHFSMKLFRCLDNALGGKFIIKKQINRNKNEDISLSEASDIIMQLTNWYFAG